MRQNVQRYGLSFIILHWLLAAASLLLLGHGWYLQSQPTTTDLNVELAALHVSLGLTTGILVALALLVRLFSRAPPYPDGFPAWAIWASRAEHALLYLSLLAVVATGYLQQVFSGTPVAFWGTPLPIWSETNEELAQSLAQAHRIVAYAFAGAVALHLLLVVVNSFWQKGFARRMLPGASPAAAEARLLEAQKPAAEKIVQKLAGRLRLLGWMQFWLQFVLAFLSALLLQFATSGRIFSSLSLGFGDAMHWGGVSLALLCVCCALAFGYTRIAGKLTRAPESYLAAKSPRFWRVATGFALSLLGAAIAFIGVALSIVLLVAKTVSQPPGIAITDPTKIIRALDVFVLLMNFTLLLAHSLGVGAGLWLGLEAKRARETCQKLRAETPPPEVAGGAATTPQDAS